MSTVKSKVAVGNSSKHDELRVSLAGAIASMIEWRELKQVEAAALMQISPSKLSVLLSYAKDPSPQTSTLSIGKMLQCINLLGVDVDLIVRRPRSKHPQHPGTSMLNLA
jgi:predicted XRE-type DNA-binding protein